LVAKELNGTKRDTRARARLHCSLLLAEDDTWENLRVVEKRIVCSHTSLTNESWYDEVFVGRSRRSFEGFDREEGNACLARTWAFIFRDSVLLQERVCASTLVAHMTREIVIT